MKTKLTKVLMATALTVTMAGALSTGGIHANAQSLIPIKEISETELNAVFGNNVISIDANDFKNMDFAISDAIELDDSKFYDNLVKDGILTKSEVSKLKAADKKVSKLYENIDFEKVSDAKLEKLDKEAAKIYDAIADIEAKLGSSLIDCEAIEMDDSKFYDSLVKDGILTKSEVSKLKAADEKVSKLYENIDFEKVSDAKLEKLDKEAAKIYDAIADIEAKLGSSLIDCKAINLCEDDNCNITISPVK